MRVCDVYLEEAFLYNRTLTYSVEGFDVSKGIRVEVRVKNRKLIGIVDVVYDVDVDSIEYTLLPIVRVVDSEPLLTEELNALAKWMQYQTVSPYISCVQAMLPNPLKPKSTAKRVKQVAALRLVPVYESYRLTPKQQELIDCFQGKEYLLIQEVKEIYSGYRVLIEKGILVKDTIEAQYSVKPIEKTVPQYELSSAQKGIIDTINTEEENTYLLHGVTGSGKTEIYLNLAQAVIDSGKQVLICVPEIGLTPQMIHRVSSRFGEDIVIYHSRLNDQEKYQQYQRVLNNQARIVVGTRSSVFLPFSNLGLIVLDEEHDDSYKQSNTPMYHARDVARWRSNYYKCPLILGSASPSLDSYARALKGIYTLLELPKRINDMLPHVEIVDTQEALQNRENAMLTQALQDSIQETLDKHEQVMLLLNRRGYLTWVKDVENDAVLMCPHCDVALNYHHNQRMLKCHICDYQTQAFPKSKEGSPLKIIGGGVGTQRLEHWLTQTYTDAKILRMDRDTTRTKNSHDEILEAFENHRADILIGTQMISKGLDNPNVTLVGIVNIDGALARSDYRSVEQTFSLVLQASGRSGRGQKRGKVLIQTFNPNHYAIVYGVTHNYKAFFKQEMQYRKLAGYPPYRYLIALSFKDAKEESTMRAAMAFVACLQQSENMTHIGPTQLGKLQSMYRARIILKGKNIDAMLKSVHEAMNVYRNIEKVGVSVDVNPLTLE